jgi:hypothetical protein
MSHVDTIPTATQDPDLPSTPLWITRVIPPEPHFGAGTYDVRLELTRPMTRFEVHALHCARHGLQPAGRVLTVCDTTLERVEAEAGALGALVRHAEEAGRRQQEAARRREARSAAIEEREAARLAGIAQRIRFPH